MMRWRPPSPEARATVLLLAATMVACTAGPRRTETATADPAPREASGAADVRGALVRVVLQPKATQVELSAGAPWRLHEADGETVLLRANGGERWRVEQRGTRMRAVRPDGVASAWRHGSLIARPLDDAAPLAVGGKRYRGDIALVATDSGLLVVNHVAVEDYLRGVVPLEIGNRPLGERAAAEAQAVAARSFAYGRLRAGGSRTWDLRAGTLDQVYGGVDAERQVSDQAVAATAGLVLSNGGRLLSAPYHSTCGGRTAAPSEVWRGAVEPHLQSVSDLRPGGDRAYCDVAPRFRWERTLPADELRLLLDRYLSQYVAVPPGGVGAVRALAVEETTASGRVARLAIETERGVYRLRGNEIRFVLRSRGGEILESTYFSVRHPPVVRGESPAVATLEGRGYGHGVGMCQWGAIGRAREGQDFRTILATYYPGAELVSIR